MKRSIRAQTKVKIAVSNVVQNFGFNKFSSLITSQHATVVQNLHETIAYLI
jgi:hypothetical protein